MSNEVKTDGSGAITGGVVLAAEAGANTGLAFHPNGNLVVSAWCGRLDLWRIDQAVHLQGFGFPPERDESRPTVDSGLLPPFAGRTPRENWPGQLLPITALCFAGTGLIAAVGAWIRTFTLSPEGDQLFEGGRWEGDGHLILGAAVSANMTALAAVTSAGNLLIWDIATGQLTSRQALPAMGRCVAFDRDSQSLLFVGDEKGFVRSWDLAAGKANYAFQGHEGPVTQVHPGPSSLVSVGADQSATAWRYDDLGASFDSFQHRAYMSACVVAPEAGLLITGSHDGYVAAWDLDPVALIGWHHFDHPVYALALAEHGRRLAVASAEKIILTDLAVAGAIAPSAWPAALGVVRGVEDPDADDEEIIELGLYDKATARMSGEAVMGTGRPEAETPAVASIVVDGEDGGTSDEVLDFEPEPILVTHQDRRDFRPDGATQPAIKAPGLPVEVDEAAPMDPMAGVVMRSGSLRAVPDAGLPGPGAPSQAPGHEPGLSAAIAQLIAWGDILVGVLVALVGGAVAWAALFTSDEARSPWVSVASGASVAITLFAATLVVLVARRIKRNRL